jgi:hypothetical protein
VSTLLPDCAVFAKPALVAVLTTTKPLYITGELADSAALGSAPSGWLSKDAV